MFTRRTTFPLTIAATAALCSGLVAPATAAEVTAHVDGELQCSVTYTDQEKDTLRELAANYVTARAAFGTAVFPALASKLSVSEQDLWALGNKKDKDARKAASATVEKAAEVAGWNFDEVKELASFGRKRDAGKYESKYLDKYAKFNVDSDDWDGDLAKVMLYKKAATEDAARFEYFDAGDHPSAPFAAFVKDHSNDFKAPFMASYELKAVGLRALSACVSAYAAKKPGSFTLDGPIVAPDKKITDQFPDEPKHGHKHKEDENQDGNFVWGQALGILGGIAGVIAVLAALLYGFTHVVVPGFHRN